MESDREEQQKALQPSAGQKPKRFRLVKLEERIAPSTVQPMGGTRGCYTVVSCNFVTCWDCPSFGFHCTHGNCITWSPGHCKV